MNRASTPTTEIFLECPGAPVADRTSRNRSSKRLNVREYADQIKKLIHRIAYSEHPDVENMDLMMRWELILAILMLFDIQLVHTPPWGQYSVYLMRYKGKIYTSVAIAVEPGVGIDLYRAQQWSTVIARLTNCRFRHLKDWFGVDDPLDNFLCAHQRETAYEEALAVVKYEEEMRIHDLCEQGM